MLYAVLGGAAIVLLLSIVFLLRTGPTAAAPTAPKPTPEPEPPKAPSKPSKAAVPSSPKPLDASDMGAFDDEAEITIVKVTLEADAFDDLEEDDEEDQAVARTVPIVADRGADEDEPTRANAAILVSAAGQTDRGQRRKRNEDRFLRMDSHGVYVVADGMGGYAGGDVASETAVETIEKAFSSGRFAGTLRGELPRRAAELARSMQMANLAIHKKAQEDPRLKDMGTTLVAARFSMRKERLYLGHVGDSRCYRVRGDEIEQLTTDHTLGNLGLTGPQADYLSRAVGIKSDVTIDVIIGKPIPGDIYLLCSDGLTKMVPDENEIRDIILDNTNMDLAVQKLVNVANERGGRDNVTVVLVAVRNPGDIAVAD